MRIIKIHPKQKHKKQFKKRNSDRPSPPLPPMQSDFCCHVTVHHLWIVTHPYILYWESPFPPLKHFNPTLWEHPISASRSITDNPHAPTQTQSTHSQNSPLNAYTSAYAAVLLHLITKWHPECYRFGRWWCEQASTTSPTTANPTKPEGLHLRSGGAHFSGSLLSRTT